MRHEKWFHSEPANVIDLTADRALQRLLDDYCGEWSRSEGWNRRRVLLTVLETAYEQLGARTAIVERRYTDVDYQDEHSRFYSRTFRHYPPTAHRVHFFREPPPHEVYDPDVAAVFDGLKYLGYSVVRPVPGASVGRTMLAVPPALQGSVTCLATDTINFFGKTHTVAGAPFIAQDNQLGICAHAAAWAAAYYHHLRYEGRRILPGDISDAVGTALTDGRSVPTQGMRLEQLCDVLEEIGIPPVVYYTKDMDPPRDIDKIARRYLDSALPVIVGTAHHAFTIIGYKAERGKTTYICQDDEVGPYQQYRRPTFTWASDAWKYLIAPVPPPLYIPCEAAELLGRARLRQDLNQVAKAEDPAAAKSANQMLAQLNVRKRGYGFVTSAIRSNDFKATLIDRGYSQRVARGYMRLPMSKWIWVVEVVDLQAFREHEPAVVAEAIIDSTEHIRDPHVLAWRVPGVLRHWNGDSEEVGELEIDVNQEPARSMCATSNPRLLNRR